MLATQLIVDFLVKKGVKNVFELSGGMIMQLIDTIYLDGRLNLVTIHHEQTAAFAADAVGRYTGIPGVAIATSGPGATNLITGIASSYFDSSPTIFITGQVNRIEQKGDKNIRQLGFQETDIVSMVKPITKFAVKLEHIEQLEEVLEYAFQISIDGRPGPVLIDIPMDIFRSEVIPSIKIKDVPTAGLGVQKIDVAVFDQIIYDIKASNKPLILAGGGINASKSILKFRDLVKILNVPVVTSLMAVDVLPANNNLRAGFIGTYGNRWSNIALSKSDLIIVLGSRLDIRQTGADTISFANNKKIYHIDCEKDETNNRIKGCHSIIANLNQFISEFVDYLKKSNNIFENLSFLNEIKDLEIKYPDIEENKSIDGVNPNEFIKRLSEFNKNIDVYVADVGQHQMWTAQSLRLNENQKFFTSGGMGAMGFALPAAIGLSLYTSNKICVIAGDAGFQLNIQELETIKRYDLNILIIILNNKCHGMTRQFQETYFNKRYTATINGYSAPNFVAIAKAYGIDAFEINKINDFDKVDISQHRSLLLNVNIDTNLNAYPKLAFGLPMSEMEPFAKPNEMEST